MGLRTKIKEGFTRAKNYIFRDERVNRAAATFGKVFGFLYAYDQMRYFNFEPMFLSATDLPTVYDYLHFSTGAGIGAYFYDKDRPAKGLLYGLLAASAFNGIWEGYEMWLVSRGGVPPSMTDDTWYDIKNVYLGAVAGQGASYLSKEDHLEEKLA